jgi:hypothetical protein
MFMKARTDRSVFMHFLNFHTQVHLQTAFGLKSARYTVHCTLFSVHCTGDSSTVSDINSLEFLFL